MTYTDSEVLTITGLTQVKCSDGKVDNVGGARASSALLCPKSNPVDFTYVDGDTPTSGKSIRLTINMPFTISGYNNIKNASFFNVDSASATLYVQYSYGN